MHNTSTLPVTEADPATLNALAEVGDSILLDVAKATRTKRVKAGPRARSRVISANQSGESRAWSRGGMVD